METERINTAVQFLKDGGSFKVGDLRLGVISKSCIYVTGWSQFSDIENLTKYKATLELAEIRDIFKKMVNGSLELSKFIQGKVIKYNLALNYGMGAIGICSEINGMITWEIEFS